MPRFTRPQTAFLVAVCVSACATSGTRPAPATPELVHAAQLQQQEVLITHDLRQQRRVDDVGHTILAVATPYCAGAVTSGTGVRFANVNSFPSTYEDAARAVGFSDTVVIVSVARGSAAARAGIEVGDRVMGVNDGTAPRGPNAASQLARSIASRGAAAPRLTLRHGDTTFLMDAPARKEAGGTGGSPSSDTHVTVPADTVCGYNLIASRKDEVNAWADGVNVTVTAAMLRFVVDNDELAAVLAHEIAHNALGHVMAQQQSRIDGSFGAIVDTSAAVRAMHANGEAGRQPLDVGSLVFSQAQERDADDVAMYLLARAGRPVGEVTNLWRHVAQHNPANVKYVGLHPTTKARLTRLERAEREMPGKIARGERPTPAVASASAVGATESLAMYELSAGDSVSYTFGPPVPRDGLSLVEVRRRALQAYQDGNEALELRLYDQAEARFRDAVLYDGSEARYHAALGATLLKRGKRAEAEAVLSAAVLLDVDNAEYRRLLVAARQRDR
jgi:hypothetical protein